MRAVIIMIAIVSAAIAVFLMFFMPETNGDEEPLEDIEVVEPEAEETEPEMVDVLVASEDISRGEVIDEDVLEWESWPVDNLREGYLTRDDDPDIVADITNFVVRADIGEGTPVRLSRLGGPTDAATTSLEFDLPSGRRAIAVPVSVSTTAGGFILPGSRVDIMHVYSAGRDLSQTRIIASDVGVIALDQRRETDEETSSFLGSTATLEVSLDQARRISRAQRDGQLVLMLRSVADRDQLTGEIEDPESHEVNVISSGRMQVETVD